MFSFDDIPPSSLDEIDKMILSALHSNSRISYTDLAKKVNLSRVAVQARVQAMIEDGLLEKFTIVINPEKLGIRVSAFFNVEVEPQYLMKVAEQLANESCVTSLYHMTGPSKLHMHGLFASNREMEQFLQEKLYPLPGIMSVETQILIKRYKSRMGMKL
ncbi:Lrp/AsnC family transcriptional regulator [Paenibacillus thiaminolyticus]|uniref:Lrp/AsnC family transcriptional regulator n=1 Tax=Paenibacillus thiaminolyticus TaxID=49283 RepID=A0AAP9DWF0_PANTH|nr:Lrp/AsnC family transcriptional regulator [Paenibacillus thiaminolyticus]MCY9534041.1 Lrp/AsnC family transcriptional regulator [Paenibacillus thiaminolyticus]MCY9603730.1 Lrp/AsnC family transcriptional regulator [Paenibacillus thiaminolyticus]MCY9610351.1 Lrp/AsnC family transcriptional regulator [Paenibacillus thiaminolyticus]MCY9614559.1 Lrp/AsnC family transcriptional regulator [Paenibacillus thiaminolyticus]MCY9618912.1 Lrp/AsnC family transcriptional regulator [Paenibacillus thiamino